MHFAFVFLVLLWPVSFGQHLADEAIYTINGIKLLHTVNEKFVSFSIDPAVLLTGLNLSETTLRITKHLAPAFVRIAGPSTQFVKYKEESWDDQENGFIAVTPSMWFGINEWLASANVTPVFGINDVAKGDDGWNPQETMEVLDMADKFNVSCYWQLGFDCSNKSEKEYKSDLKRLKHVLDAFPQSTKHWKVVGSDPRKCTVDYKKTLDELENVLTAVVLEQPTSLENPFYLHIKPKVPIWVTLPKSSHPVSFASAISWAKEIGEAAKNGFDVILRQPRLHEIYSETPTFWVSALHKMFMGRNVLEAKTTINHPDLSLYAHCTKHQNDFIRSGAMTVMVVNNCTTNHTVLLKFSSFLLKSTEVRSYVLTAESQESTDVFLNGEKITLNDFTGDKFNVNPKLRRARIMNYLSLFLPPKSVGFFILPGAQIPVCQTEESDLKLLMEEINEDQNIPFLDKEISVDIHPRLSHHRSATLREMQNVMEKELASDERYYKQMKQKMDGRNFFIERAKDKKTEVEVPKKFDFTFKPHKKEEPKKIFELELSSGEIRKVLADRAKVKAARKNIIFTSGELEEIMHKATQKILNNKNTVINVRKKSKRDTTRDKKDINMRLLKLKAVGADKRKTLKETLKNRKNRVQASLPNRGKRDINMDLLKLKTESGSKFKKISKKFGRKDKIQDIEKEDKSVEKLEEKEESLLPDKDVFAELAESDEYTTTVKPQRKPFFSLKKPLPKIQTQPISEEFKNQLVQEDFPEISDIGDDSLEGYRCIHDFYAKVNSEANIPKKTSELWEVVLPTEETRNENTILEEIRKINVDEIPTESKSEDIDCMDYGDFESDESSPVRLKRDNKDILGDTYDPMKIKIDNDLKDQQFKLLKEYRMQKKKLNFINKNTKLVNKRKVRSLFQKNEFKDRYKSLTEGLKEWKPSDILKLENPKKRTKKSVDHDVESVENDIGEFLNEWRKDGTKEKPQVDVQNGDYQLVFPNQDKIEVVENKGDTEIKLVIHGDAQNATSDKEDTKTNIQKIEKHHSRNVWNKLLQKLSKFFQGLSSKLKKCILDDLLNSV